MDIKCLLFCSWQFPFNIVCMTWFLVSFSIQSQNVARVRYSHTHTKGGSSKEGHIQEGSSTHKEAQGRKRRLLLETQWFKMNSTKWPRPTRSQSILIRIIRTQRTNWGSKLECSRYESIHPECAWLPFVAFDGSNSSFFRMPFRLTTTTITEKKTQNSASNDQPGWCYSVFFVIFVIFAIVVVVVAVVDNVSLACDRCCCNFLFVCVSLKMQCVLFVHNTQRAKGITACKWADEKITNFSLFQHIE